MPQFPRYNSRQELSTRLPGVIKTGSSLPYEIIGQALEKTQDITQKWGAAVENMQETHVKARATEALLQAEANAEADTNINGEEGQFKQLKEGKREWLKGVPESGFKERLSFELDHQINLASIKIKGIYAKKKLFADHMNTGNLLDSYARIGTPEAYQEAFKLIEGKVASGFYSPEQGQALFNKTQKAGLQNDIFSDPALQDSESEVLTQLNKGPEGRYAFLDVNERTELIKETQRHIKQNQLNQVETRINDRLAILNDFASGKIDPDTSKDYITQLSIQDPELGEAIIRGSDTVFMPKLDDEAFASATQEVFKASTKEEISRYLVNVLNQNANKDIGRERLAILINAATERAKSLRATASSQPITISPKQAETDSLIKSLLYNPNPLLSVPNMIINFFKGIGQNYSPREAHDAALRAEVSRTNPLSVKYKIGDIITNPAGISAEVVGFNENGSPIVRRKK